ncbi:unnamed protein product [Pleuronectes platessa]|uniref:Uncharacterized protein n=1 Tax=Pleuronectes platessa TaxID=8262 RepID=A0A9N7Y1J7_PLEPL|nr:unnamed protein product [Pleuronectes platessa]
MGRQVRDYQVLRQETDGGKNISAAARRKSRKRVQDQEMADLAVPFEIGCRGFKAKSTWQLLSALRLDGKREHQQLMWEGGGGRTSLLLAVDEARSGKLGVRS